MNEAQRIEELEAEVAWLKGDGADALARIKSEFVVTPLEARFLLVLARRDQMSHGQVLDALYGDRPDDPPDLKIPSVLVCHLRAKLRRRLTILTTWGVGYRLDAESRAMVLAVAGETTSSANGGMR